GEQRRLADPVRADDAEHRARLAAQRDRVAHRPAASDGGDLVEAEVGHARDRPSRSARNTGAPTSAHTTPVCSTAPVTTVRAAVSASSRNAAPKSAANGSSRAWAAPMTRRSACGTTSPTKLMTPETA